MSRPELRMPFLGCALATGLLTGSPVAAADAGAYCTLPGEQVVEGDGGLYVRIGFTDVGTVNPLPGQQIEAIYWAEPASFSDQVVITLKVDSLEPAAPASDMPPPESLYQVFFELADGNRYYVLFDPAAAEGQQFTFGGNVDINQTDSVDTHLGFADEASLARADGTIQWVMTRGKLPAFSLSKSAVDVYGLVKINNPVSGGYRGVNSTLTGEYLFRGNQSCAGTKTEKAFGGSVAMTTWLLLVVAALRRKGASVFSQNAA
jgi:hypothetical protein